MAAMIDTERRGLMRKLGSGLVVRNVCKIGAQSAATTSSGEEAQIELVAGADRRLAEARVSCR